MSETNVVQFPSYVAVRWFHDYDKVLALGVWLNNQNRFKDPDEVLGYFQNPWKWSRDYYAMQSVADG